jgi:hypothetical protein
MATIRKIEASYGEKAAGIVWSWYETQDKRGREIEPIEGPYADLYTADQRARGAHTQKAERAQAKPEEYCKEHKDSSHRFFSHQLTTPRGVVPIG